MKFPKMKVDVKINAKQTIKELKQVNELLNEVKAKLESLNIMIKVK